MKMYGSIQFSEGSLTPAINKVLNEWKIGNKSQRLWSGDASLWTNSDEAHWLGWLASPELTRKEIPQIEKLREELTAEAIQHIVVLGMGGSSLCPAMMAETFGKIGNHARLHVLDSTDPQQIQHLEAALDLKKSLFIVSSKSGSTLEPNIFFEYFYARLQNVLGKKNVGERFIAITDPGTSLETLAKNHHFRTVFHGIPSIGGRYSALSNFGMVPCGLMGINLEEFLQNALKMVAACSPDVSATDDPGVILGAILGVSALHGKDKITFIVSPAITSLGAWLEQLLAESTGKMGKGLIPIDKEPLGVPSVYGSDRVFVYIRDEKNVDPLQEQVITEIEKANHVVIRLSLPKRYDLGAEFFRWEIATTVAGTLLKINPFNQPDVEDSKVRTKQLINAFEKTKKITQPLPIFSSDGIKLFTDASNLSELNQRVSEASIEAYLKAHLDRLKNGDYLNLSAFIEMSDEHVRLLQQCRTLIRDTKRVATNLGFGPRFLHSTGQLYKGGPACGVFIQITADPVTDLSIPDRGYTFGDVLAAQAQGDFEVLANRKRRVMRIHLGKSILQGLHQLILLLS